MTKILTALTLVALLMIGAWGLLSRDQSVMTLGADHGPATAADGEQTYGDDATAEVHSAARRTIRIPVDGMVCMACASRVRRNLSSLEGVEHVEVSLTQRRATVRLIEGVVTPEVIAERVREIGYRPGKPAAED